MTNVTCDIAMSMDGFVAGPNQSLPDPIGEGGDRLHRWMFEEPEANAARGCSRASATSTSSFWTRAAPNSLRT
jgi:hypothetical protein